LHRLIPLKPVLVTFGIDTPAANGNSGH
jgi:hypothetical protein